MHWLCLTHFIYHYDRWCTLPNCIAISQCTVQKHNVPVLQFVPVSTIPPTHCVHSTTDAV
jgi:hypothetical protein